MLIKFTKYYLLFYVYGTLVIHFCNLLVEACIAVEKTVVGTDVVAVETIVGAAEINNQTCLVSMQ